MKFKDYLKGLNEVAQNDPSTLMLDVIYSSDDEGNSFDNVKFSPTIGEFKHNDFIDDSDKPNAICIN